MGLTIHYSLKSDADSPAAARQQVEKLRQAALDLPLAEVGEVIELPGAECDPERQAGGRRETLAADPGPPPDPDRRGILLRHADPRHRLLGMAGRGMRGGQSRFGNLPGDHRDRGRRVDHRPAAAGLAFFCKTQFTSNPSVGGMENFVRCHLAVIRLLDAAKAIGILEEVKDEGGYWENRDVKALVETVGSGTRDWPGWPD